MTYREMYERIPENQRDEEVIIVDPYNGNVWTGVDLAFAEDDKVEEGDGCDGDTVLYYEGDPVLIIP